jgi:MFS family permease
VILASIVDGDALAEVIAVSFAAGISVTAAYATAIASLTRLSERRRERRTMAATAYAWLAGLALAASVGAVALGIFVMATN